MSGREMDKLLDSVCMLYENDISNARDEAYEQGFDEGREEGFIAGYEAAYQEINPT